MKKHLLGLILIGVFALQQSVAQSNTTIISGKILNSNAKAVQIKSMMKDTAWTFKMTGGNFKGEINNALPGIYLFKLGSQYTQLYLAPGDSIFLTLDMKNFDKTLKYSGTQAAFNNYWAKTILLSEGANNYNTYLGAKPALFIPKSDSLKNSYLDFLKKYQAKNKLSKQNVKYAEAQIKYEWATVRIQYYLMHTRKKTDTLKLESNYFDFVKKSDLSNGNLMNVPAYKTFVWGWLHYLIQTDTGRKNTVNKGGTYHPFEDFEIKIDLTRHNFPDKKIKNFLYYRLVQTYTMINGNKGIEEVVKFYENQHPDSYHLAKVHQKFDKWTALEKGKPAPGFAYQNINGKTVSLKSLRGKYVYVDVWATWCGPCRGELPYLKKVEKKFEGKNIAFVSVSIDANKKAWENMVHDKKLTGIQLRADKAGYSKICTEYLITGIPRFILIDPKGNIIDANAARPSDNISKQLDSLLN